MKTLIALIISIMALNVNAGIRCGNDLILEGDPAIKMIKECGQPDQNGQNIIYLNKDKDGMNYFIHVDSNGIIDDIQESR